MMGSSLCDPKVANVRVSDCDHIPCTMQAYIINSMAVL